MRKILIALAGVALAASFPLGTVHAQTGFMDEIVVTVQRREENVQDVPVATTAYSDLQLQRLGVRETLDMVKLAPNFIGHNNTGLGSANTYSLRGLNNTESIATFDPPVGSYVDDIYITRQNANNFALFDIDRIEVLRGPQGTLFGRNTTGGAVRTILKKPSDEMAGFIEGGVGSYDLVNARGSIDVPLSDTVLTKFSGYWIDDDGFVLNQTTGEDTVNDEQSFGLRAAVSVDINENWDWDGSVTFVKQDHANMLNFKSGSERITNTGLTKFGAPVFGILVGDKANQGLGNEIKSWLFVSNLSTETRYGTLELISGYYDLDQDFLLDFFDGSASYGGFTIANEGEHSSHTQELKLTGSRDRWEYVAGIYYIDEDNDTDFGDIFDLGFPLVLADRTLENETEAWAAYVQGDYQLNDLWTMTLGVRYTDEEKDITFRPTGCPEGITNGDYSACANPNWGAPFGSTEIAAAGAPLKQSEELWTPRVAFEYNPADNQMYYIAATRGFKSGGWNARGTGADQIQPFAAEKVWSYEAGMRSDWYDNTLRVNLTAFWSDISDFQLPSAFTTGSGGIVFITRNFADLEVKGAEAEIVYTPDDRLTILAALGWQDAEYKSLDPSITAQQAACQAQLAAGDPPDDCGVGIVDFKGDIAEPVRTPEYSATVNVNYVYPLNGDMDLVPSVTATFYGDHSVGTSGGPESLVDGYETYDASLALENNRNNWRLVAACRNCNDRRMVVSTLAGFQYLADPRTWSLSLRKDFSLD